MQVLLISAICIAIGCVIGAYKVRKTDELERVEMVDTIDNLKKQLKYYKKGK